MCQWLHKMILTLVVVAVFVVLIQGDAWDEAAKLAKQMTLEEQVGYIHGVGKTFGTHYAGATTAVPRLGIPALTLEDGPQGVGDGTHNSTAFPSGLTTAASWNPVNAELIGQAIAKEMRAKGVMVMLGPELNIVRVPGDGRNYESMAGEDPVLAATLAGAYVKGGQGEKVIVNCKHYDMNNQETNRMTISEVVPQRAQMEIYRPGFEGCVNAGVLSVMCSYNKINGTYACENKDTLGLLRQYGFKGFVVSDWGATHSLIASLEAGLDLSMPNNQFYNLGAIQTAIQQGKLNASTVEQRVVNILGSMISLDLIKSPPKGELSSPARSPNHLALARKVAAQGTILLKNENNILPIDLTLPVEELRIAVLGDDADFAPVAEGGGSGAVCCENTVSPAAAFKAAMVERGMPATNILTSRTVPASTAAQQAKQAGLAMVCVSAESSEGMDRQSLRVSAQQEAMISAVAAAQPNTVVVVHSTGAVVMPWLNQVRAVVMALMPGEQDGNALLDVLLGTVNPAGRLPFTIPANDSQLPFLKMPRDYPGVNGVVYYTENLKVGYRFYDSMKLTPAFEFGFGLSYSTFKYSGLTLTTSGGTMEAVFTLHNLGPFAGDEVVQLYLTYPAAADEPPVNLKHYRRVPTVAGSSQAVSFTLTTAHDARMWDATKQAFVVMPGTYTVSVGSSSRNLPLTAKFTVGQGNKVVVL